MPNAADAIANDVQYDLKCWVQAQRKVFKTHNDATPDIEDVYRVLADIEIINCEVPVNLFIRYCAQYEEC